MKALARIATIRVAAGLLAASTAPIAEATGPEDEDAGAHSIDHLAFLAGAWRGELFGGVAEEYWTAPRAGTMLGLFRLMRDGRTSVTEYILIEEADERVTLRFKHFSPAFEAWETDAPLTFHLVEMGAQRALFRSPDPAQSPNLLEYQLETDMLAVRIEGPGEGGGKPDQFTVRFVRMSD